MGVALNHGKYGPAIGWRDLWRGGIGLEKKEGVQAIRGMMLG